MLIQLPLLFHDLALQEECIAVISRNRDSQAKRTAGYFKVWRRYNKVSLCSSLSLHPSLLIQLPLLDSFPMNPPQGSVTANYYIKLYMAAILYVLEPFCPRLGMPADGICDMIQCFTSQLQDQFNDLSKEVKRR